jgi:UDP-2,3-diacylglucosamine hydrolase
VHIPITRVTVPDQDTLFFSDAHLGGKGPPQQVILDLLDRHAGQVGTIFNLGDLFDFWYGYRTVVFAQFLPLLIRLRQLADAGTAIHYIAGNHDFSLGTAFREHLGVQTYEGALDVRLGGMRLYLAHGDLVRHDDVGYRVLHRVVRSRPMSWLIRMIPPDVAWGIAMRASRSSRRYTTRLQPRTRELFHLHARGLFEQGYDGVMTGHSHLPELGRERLVHPVPARAGLRAAGRGPGPA